jgi:hypothetical protein
MAVNTIVIVIVLISMLIRYKLGFGFSLTLVPLSALLLDFDTAFKMAILLEIFSGTLMVIQFWKHVRLLDAFLLKVFSLVGLGLGVVSKLYVPRKLVVILSMVTIIITCIYFLKNVNRKVTRNNFKLGMSGILSGFLNSWTSLSGPPVVIYYLKTEESNAAIKGLLSGYFLILYAFTFLIFLFQGEYSNFAGWGHALYGSVAILVGYIPIKKLADRVRFDLGKGALIFITGAGLIVIFKEIF